MADFGSPVAQNVAPPNPGAGVTMLSNLLSLKQQQLGIARQQIGLSQAQQQLSSETSAATTAAITAQQTKALSQLNPKQWLKPDGSLDVDAASQDVMSVAPNLGPDYLARLQTAAQGSVETKKAYLSLNGDLQKGLRDIFGSWSADPKATPTDLAQQLQAWQETLPSGLQDAGEQIEGHVLKVLTGPNLVSGQPHSVQEQKAAALAYARAGLAPSEVGGPGGLATPVPGTVSTGTQIVPTKTNRITGSTTTAGAPVASLHNQISLPNGQVAILNTASGQYEIAAGGKGGSAAPAGAAPPAITAENDPARPSANAPAQIQAQWQKSLADTNALVHSTRQEDQSYGNNMAIAQDIRSLSRSAGGKNIGPGTPEWTKFVGSLTSRFGGSQGVTDVQTLESFLDRQAASMTSAMGLPATNLGNEQARVISGNIGMQVGALRAKNDYNEALAQGLHDYRSGLDKVAGFGGNASPTAVNRYRAEWAKYFNPMAVEYNLAKQRGDRDVMTAIAKSVTPGQAKRMLGDLDAMSELASTGKLP